MVPCTIFEITSKQTGSADLSAKYQLYEQLAIKEYFLFDRLDEYLQPHLQGFTLVQGCYQVLPLSSEAELISRGLGLILQPQGDLLRLVDSSTRQLLAISHESVRRAELAEQKTQWAEAKIIELQQELEKLRRKKN